MEQRLHTTLGKVAACRRASAVTALATLGISLSLLAQAPIAQHPSLPELLPPVAPQAALRRIAPVTAEQLAVEANDSTDEHELSRIATTTPPPDIAEIPEILPIVPPASAVPVLTGPSDEEQEHEPVPVPADPPGVNHPSRADLTWWSPRVHRPLRDDVVPVQLTLEQIFAATLEHSAFVRVISDLPLIRETSILEADAQFDWVAFVESSWNDISQPVGSLLTTGGPTRYLDRNLNTLAGLRRRNALGGQFEVGQNIGQQNTNSRFFIPDNQGTSRLTINYTQPLLRNAGRAYNTALTVLAQIDTAAAQDELSQQLQDHLVKVTEAYWQLYLERGRLLLQQRRLSRAEEILKQLELRRELDALQSQIVRARAAVASRRAEIVRSDTEVKNAESRLRALVNDPDLGTASTHELIPLDKPQEESRELDIGWSVETALQYRPEVGKAIKSIRSAGVKLGAAKNGILPALNLVLETYGSGLRGDYDIGGSLVDQFSVGAPSYSVGLQYEVPFWNRASRAAYLRRRLELRQLESQLQMTLENLRSEVEVAAREVGTTYREMQANYTAMEAADEAVTQIYEWWQVLSGSDRSASLLLENLLDAQERLYVEEESFLRSQLSYNVSHIAYLRALGTLLQSESISLERYCDRHLPGYALRQLEGSETDALSQRVVDLPAANAPAKADADRSALQLPENGVTEGRFPVVGPSPMNQGAESSD
jgi:outer membrane protein TolC